MYYTFYVFMYLNQLPRFNIRLSVVSSYVRLDGMGSFV